MTDFSLSFSPLLPLWVLVALAILGACVIGFGLFTRRRGMVLRALGLALVLLALADPSLVREEREKLKDVVAIVVDGSASQSFGERAAQTQAARVALEKQLGDLGNIDVRVIDSAAGNRTADGTRLFAALQAGLNDVSPERIGGVFLITDGVVHDIPPSADALGLRAPLHAFITGREGERDRRIELVEAPRFGLVGKEQVIVARVLDSGKAAGALRIRVSRDGELIANVAAKVDERVRIPVRIDHGGPNVFELDVEALPDELTPVNNKAVATIEGIRDKLKVLLVSGEPHAGERTWRNLLRSDANVELVHFTILRPPEKQDGTPINELSLIAFPTNDLFSRKIKDFDLIIFDRYSNQTILPAIYFENIMRYVREGGALLMAVGPDYAKPSGLYYSPLGRIAPAQPDGTLTERAFFPTITPNGKKHPVTRGLAGGMSDPPGWSPWFRQVNSTLTRGTSVLSGADDKPLIVLSREEKGRVALLLTDQMWLWARGFEGGGPHLDVQRRIAHWLMKEPELEEESLRASVTGREIAITRQSLKDVIPSVKIIAPSGKESLVTLSAAEPGLSTARFVADELGLHRLSDGALNVLANVGPENPREYQEVISTPEHLRGLAEATGGTVRRIGVGASADVVLPRLVDMRESPIYGGSDYVGVKRTGASTVKGVGVAPLALGLLGVLVLLAAVLASWFFESRRKI